MEFKFDINQLLPDEITFVDNKLCPFRNALRVQKEKSVDDQKRELSKLIDAMGIASSKAQGLKGVITSGIKLAGSDHHLYLLKDSQANNGKGAVLGLIKVGFKRLFVVDIHYQQLEVNPLCVLDFYVHESRQRNGCGLRLFKAMLEREHVKPEYLAYDRPSSKFLNFLRKHFDLQKVVNQMNNYTVFTSFFHNLSAVGYVPGNRRFISSAPIDSRLPSVQEQRRISSANSSGRKDSFHNDSLSRFRGIQPSGGQQTPSMRNETSSLMSELPPRPPGRQNRCSKDQSWSRRNGSNLPFARNNRSTELTFFASNSSSGNAYSRHTYTQERSKTNDRLSTISPVTGRHSLTRSHHNPESSSPLGSSSNRKSNTGAEFINHGGPTDQIKSSQGSEGHKKDSNSKGDNQTSDKSYSIDNMYIKSVSLANSSPGTSWNIFRVNPRRSSANCLDKNRSPYNS